MYLYMFPVRRAGDGDAVGVRPGICFTPLFLTLHLGTRTTPRYGLWMFSLPSRGPFDGKRLWPVARSPCATTANVGNGRSRRDGSP